MNSERDPIRVIYVAGTSYSGSTILGAILGMHSEIESPGEIRAWVLDRSEIPVNTANPAKESMTLWSRVKEHAWDGLPHATWATFKNLIRKFEGYSSAPTLLFQKIFFRTKTFRTYSQYTKTFLRTIAESNGKAILVDTSKRPFRLLALSMVEDVDLVYIHLIKSPATYIESVKKRRLQEWLRSGNSVETLNHQSINDWLWNNLLVEIAIWLSGVRGVKIKYEDFAHAPACELEKIASIVEIDLCEVIASVDRGDLIQTGQTLGSGLVKKGPQSFMKKPPYSHQSVPTRGLQRFIIQLLEHRYGYI